MCSGCSGDGDYSYFDDAEWVFPDQRQEPDVARQECHDAGRQPPAAGTVPPAEHWEVLVSGQRIVEIHYLGAPSPAEAEGIKSRAGSGENAIPRYGQAVWQSGVLSAEYYQTSRPGVSGPVRHRVIPFLYIGLSVLTSALLAAWALLN